MLDDDSEKKIPTFSQRVENTALKLQHPEDRTYAPTIEEVEEFTKFEGVYDGLLKLQKQFLRNPWGYTDFFFPPKEYRSPTTDYFFECLNREDGAVEELLEYARSFVHKKYNGIAEETVEPLARKFVRESYGENHPNLRNNVPIPKELVQTYRQIVKDLGFENPGKALRTHFGYLREQNVPRKPLTAQEIEEKREGSEPEKTKKEVILETIREYPGQKINVLLATIREGDANFKNSSLQGYLSILHKKGILEREGNRGNYKYFFVGRGERKLTKNLKRNLKMKERKRKW